MERSTTVHDALDTLQRRCREGGHKLTPQRREVCAAVAGSGLHPTPEQVFESVGAAMPTLSRATVYKTLDFLVDLGIVRRVATARGSRRYDINLVPHHHLLCEVCDRIVDFADPKWSALPASEHLDGFAASELRVEITGVCADCGASSPQKVPSGTSDPGSGEE